MDDYLLSVSNMIQKFLDKKESVTSAKRLSRNQDGSIDLEFQSKHGTVQVTVRQG